MRIKTICSLQTRKAMACARNRANRPWMKFSTCRTAHTWKNMIRGSWLDVSLFSHVGKAIRDIWLVYIGLRTKIFSAAFQCVNLSMYIIKTNYSMESALYGIYAFVFVSENSLVRYSHSFVCWYANSSCVNTVRAHFPWSNLYLFPHDTSRKIGKYTIPLFNLSIYSFVLIIIFRSYYIVHIKLFFLWK